MRRSRALLVVALALAGCSSDTTTSNPDAAPTGGVDAPIGLDAPVVSAGVITLGGAVSGTLTAAVTGLKLDSDSFTTVAIGETSRPVGVQSVAASLTIDGAPTVQDYVAPALRGTVMVVTDSGKTYAATSGQNQGVVGTLTLTSASGVEHTNGITIYRLGGSFSATLVNLSGGGDTVSFSITF